MAERKLTDAMRAMLAAGSHLTLANGQPHVLIPDNDFGIPEGPRDVVALLREHAEHPDVVRFIADMLEI